MTAFLNALIRAVLVWLLLMAAESLQGAARRLLLSPALEQALRQISVLVGVLVIAAITWALLPWMRIRTTGQALATGAMWALLTLAFEFGLGGIMGRNWSQMLVDYDLNQGGLMPIGLLAMALVPWAVWRLQSRTRRASTKPDRRLRKSP
ncbi:hypothetical protein GGQ61_000053 [Phenylobacterium haematophilum]|uniref:Uncharacterized protein n=1 Tax=Phenylobacterium haematophilum TaxID=98513 RepID=A0A839ZT00_9CAUL|nr:hypothetical protein [Phenylobacterium haematophilum]MBB3889356.1 hypothetical protein [Phenylobacterium haematophilum]